MEVLIITFTFTIIDAYYRYATVVKEIWFDDRRANNDDEPTWGSFQLS